MTEVRGVSGDHMRMYAAQTVAKGTGTTSLIVSLVTMHLSTRARTTGVVFQYMVGNLGKVSTVTAGCLTKNLASEDTRLPFLLKKLL